METALAIFLSTGFFVAITVLNRKLTSNAIFPTFLGLVLSLIGLLSSLNRPEFNVAFATSGLALIALNMNHRTQILKLIVLPYLSIGACYLAWRIYYYGLILPLPFYIKVAPATLAGISDVKLFFL